MSAAVAFHDLGGVPGASISGLSRARFGATVAYLNRRGWRFASLMQWFNSSSEPIDLHITLDDAFSAQLTAARAILRPLKIPATLFVVTDFVGKAATWDYTGRRRRHAGWDELSSWVEEGFSVGSHGHRHRDLRRLSDAELDLELQGSRELLEQRLGVEVRALAYPFGRHDARVREAARRAGYRLAFTASSGAGSGDTDPLAHPRVVASSLDTPLSLEQRLRGSAWGRLERGKQEIVRFWAGGTPLWQRLRGDYR